MSETKYPMTQLQKHPSAQVPKCPSAKLADPSGAGYMLALAANRCELAKDFIKAGLIGEARGSLQRALDQLAMAEKMTANHDAAAAAAEPIDV